MIITIEAQKRKLGLEEISGAAADFLFSSNELIAERSASRVKATVEAVKSVDTEALQKLGSLNNPPPARYNASFQFFCLDNLFSASS